MPIKFAKEEYKLEWIPVRLLAVVWPEAQREYKEAWAKEISESLDPDKFDPVKVTLPNGNGIFHICEGQHRTRAVEMLWGPNEQVPCLVAQETDPARAAEIFLDNNTNRNHVTKVAKFNVAVTAKRPVEVNINRIVHHNGYRVDASHAQNTIAAVEALKYAYGKGAKTLDQTLRTLRQTWSGDPAAVVALLIKGYAAFICEYGAEIDFERLRICMAKKFTPGKLTMEGKSVKETLHITGAAALVHLLLTTYNRGCRKPLKRKGSK